MYKSTQFNGVKEAQTSKFLILRLVFEKFTGNSNLLIEIMFRRFKIKNKISISKK